MNGKVLLDNWSLQEIRLLHTRGFSTKQEGEIIINKAENTHKIVLVPHAVIQIEALLDFLTNIVLREVLLVDQEWTYVWENSSFNLDSLKSELIIEPFPFLDNWQRLVEPRQLAIKELCVTDSLAELQKQNELSWKEAKKSASDFYSTVIWGGAGMLARSHIYECPYYGHPIRRKLIQDSILLRPNYDAVTQVLDVVRSNRAKVFTAITSNTLRTYSTFNLPSIAVEVINNSNNALQLIPIAIELRAKYKPLRQWLQEYQQALEIEDTKSIIKHQNILKSVSKNISSKIENDNNGSTNLSISLGIFNISWTGDFINKAQNTLGIRAALNKLILAQQGIKTIEKLINMFDAQNTMLGKSIHEHIINRHK